MVISIQRTGIPRIEHCASVEEVYLLSQYVELGRGIRRGLELLEQTALGTQEIIELRSLLASAAGLLISLSPVAGNPHPMLGVGSVEGVVLGGFVSRPDPTSIIRGHGKDSLERRSVECDIGCFICGVGGGWPHGFYYYGKYSSI